MAIPNIKITERADITSPVNINPRTRMAILGDFTSGPANEPVLLGSISDFYNQYRSDTKQGSLAFQAAYDQFTDPNNEDYVLVRVLGHQKQASGSLIFSGIATKVNTLNLNLSYVGTVVNNNTTALNEVVTFNNVYNGSTSGRMYFYVDDITTNVATIKYLFRPLNDTSTINWTVVTDNFTVDVTTEQFVAKPVADGLEVTFGVSGQTSDLGLVVGNEFYTRINKYNFSLPINVNDSPTTIAINLQNYLSGNDPIGNTFLTTANDGLIFRALEEGYPGVLGNRITYTATLTDTVDPGIVITAGGANFVGGVAGPENAYQDFYDINGEPLLRVQAKSEGIYGNNIKVSINYLAPGEFNLRVSDTEGRNFNPPIQDETFNIKLSSYESDGILADALDSVLVDVIFLPRFLDGENFNKNKLTLNVERLDLIDPNQTDPTNPQHPNHFGSTYLQNVFLNGGSNGPELEDQDFIDAIDTLDSVGVNYVLAAGQYSNAVRLALINHCENKTEQDGLRVAVLSATPGLRPSGARLEVEGFDSRYAVMVVGWTTYAGQANAPRYGLEGAAYYLGKMVNLPFYISPAYKVGAKAVRNCLESDTDRWVSKPFLDKFEEQNLEVIAKSKVYNGYYFVTGKVLTIDEAWNRIYIRRAYNQIRSDLYDLLEQYTAAPYRREVVLQILAAINAYFLRRTERGEIASFKNAQIANKDSASEDYARGFININVGFLPLSALNFIEVGIFRDNNGGVIISGL